MLKAQNINLHYGKYQILKDLDFEVQDGEFLLLIGESGSGKSTVLKVLAGLIERTVGVNLTGDIFVDTKKLRGVNTDASMVFQGAALFPWLSARENILFPFEVQKMQPDMPEIDRLIEEMGLTGADNRVPRDLSGGQRQRVGIARALAQKRKLLFLDEPFSALDIKTAVELRDELLRIWKKNNLTIVMVSHSIEEAVQLADRIILLKKGGEIKTKISIDLPRPRNTGTIEFLKTAEHVKEVIAS